jgi:hypothetical protein
MLRTIAGIVLGYLIFGVSAFLLFRLADQDPHAPAPLGFEVIAVVYGIFFAALGGYLGTAISGRRALRVAITIAAILAAGAIASLIATGISWSPVAALACMTPAAVAGGWLRLRQQ